MAERFQINAQGICGSEVTTLTNIEKLKHAEGLVAEVFMDTKNPEFELVLNCAISDIQHVRLRMEVKQEAELNSMKQGGTNG